MNWTPEVKNQIMPKATGKSTCDLCVNVNAAQTICTCIENCGPGCYWIPEDDYTPPPVPRFK